MEQSMLGPDVPELVADGGRACPRPGLRAPNTRQLALNIVNGLLSGPFVSDLLLERSLKPRFLASHLTASLPVRLRGSDPWRSS